MLLFLSAIQYSPVDAKATRSLGIKAGAMYCLNDIDGIIDRLDKHMGRYKNWIEVVGPSYDEYKQKERLDMMLKIPERQKILSTWEQGIRDVETFKFPKTLKYWQIKYTFIEIDQCDDAIDKILEEEEKVSANDIKTMIRVLHRYPIFFDELEEEVTKITDDAAKFIKTALTLKKGFDAKFIGIYGIPGLDAKFPEKE